MTTKQLSKGEIKEVNNKLKEDYGIEEFFLKKDVLLIVDDKFIVKDSEFMFFLYDTRWIPTLKLLLKQDILRKVIVDMGAVKFVTSGADIMRPGITKIDEEIKESGVLCIIDETHAKPLAVGIAMFDAETMKGMDSGKVIKNIHYVGDEIWSMD